MGLLHRPDRLLRQVAEAAVGFSAPVAGRAQLLLQRQHPVPGVAALVCRGLGRRGRRLGLGFRLGRGRRWDGDPVVAVGQPAQDRPGDQPQPPAQQVAAVERQAGEGPRHPLVALHPHPWSSPVLRRRVRYWTHGAPPGSTGDTPSLSNRDHGRGGCGPRHTLGTHVRPILPGGPAWHRRRPCPAVPCWRSAGPRRSVRCSRRARTGPRRRR
ncbi:hypothetical protein [Ornithinimicrobium kibberense]|uniref:hypothetical protein n=1 Tax=Ornithinimicrobium kibberense TaxID=282060 RepID=UPI00361FD278